MGFLRYFYISEVMDGVAIACSKCPWTKSILDVYDTAPMLQIFRQLEDHYYEVHSG